MCIWGFPNVIIRSNKFTSDIFNNFIILFLENFYYNFLLLKKKRRKGWCIWGCKQRQQMEAQKEMASLNWKSSPLPVCPVTTKKRKTPWQYNLGWTQGWAGQGYSRD